MENEDNENLDSQKQETDQEDNLETGSEEEEDEEETDDLDAVKEKNRQLFARAKKAEEQVAKLKAGNNQPRKPIVSKETDIDKLLDAKLEKREIESLDLSDSLKNEVSNYAKLRGISIKKALDSDYISFMKEKEDQKQKVDNASLGSKRRVSVQKDYSNINLSDIDLKSPEGKADFAKYEEHLRKQLG